MASNANEPVLWVPKRPLCEIGTKCHWRSQAATQLCASATITAGHGSVAAECTVKFATHREQARPNPCPDGQAVALQVQKPPPSTWPENHQHL